MGNWQPDSRPRAGYVHLVNSCSDSDIRPDGRPSSAHNARYEPRHIQPYCRDAFPLVETPTRSERDPAWTKWIRKDRDDRWCTYTCPKPPCLRSTTAVRNLDIQVHAFPFAGNLGCRRIQGIPYLPTARGPSPPWMVFQSTADSRPPQIRKYFPNIDGERQNTSPPPFLQTCLLA